MTTLIAKAPTAAQFGIGRYFRGQFAAMKASAARSAAYNKVYGQLSAMSDRDLADIGVNRGMISDIAQAASVK